MPPVRGIGLKARNETLKTWVPKGEALDVLLDIKPADLVLPDKTGVAVRVAYQQPIQAKFSAGKPAEALANTFEDALVYENIELFKSMNGTALLGRIRTSLDEAGDLGDLAKRLAADLAKGGKAKFAMKLLWSDEIDNMAVPAYIDQGLVWLADQLKRKEDEISGNAPVKAVSTGAKVAAAQVAA